MQSHVISIKVIQENRKKNLPKLLWESIPSLHWYFCYLRMCNKHSSERLEQLSIPVRLMLAEARSWILGTQCSYMVWLSLIKFPLYFASQ